MIDNNILVDIPMCTYNHAPYIAQAVEGVMIQKTKFQYRLIIGEDCSSDGTREIVRGLLMKYQDRMKVILHDRNIGVQANSKIVLGECRAKYIALCDGDDYWTDSAKLQRQVDFLEANPDYSICYHRVEELRSDGSRRPEKLNTSEDFRTITIEDLARGNTIHTPSVVYRNGLIEDVPIWVNDFVLHMLNARHGKIYYMPDIMATYRVGVGMYGSVHSNKRVIAWAETLRRLLDLEWPDVVRQNLTQALATARAVIQRNKYPRYYGARDYVVRVLGLGKIKRAIRKALTSA
jgi:glycosyltransferase involved in cell wall biosynthesis